MAIIKINNKGKISKNIMIIKAIDKKNKKIYIYKKKKKYNYKLQL